MHYQILKFELIILLSLKNKKKKQKKNLKICFKRALKLLMKAE